MTADLVPIELADIQNGALHPRPVPYVGVYLALRIDDPRAGRELLHRLVPALASASDPTDPDKQAWVSLGLTYQGLKALGVPDPSLGSFPQAFREGMAARAASLGDVGESGPENWDAPLGSLDVHVVISVLSPDAERLEALRERARTAYRDLSGIEIIWRQNVSMPPDAREPFGFRDDISQPAVEGSGQPRTNPGEAPFKAGEFLLGYPNEMGESPPIPQPDVLGRNGTYVAFTKLHTRVAAFRQFLRDNSSTPEGEELLAAKMMGRWRSGAPLALAPERDDPALGEDPARSNDFLYEADDPRGFKSPGGSHTRRMNPRDAAIVGVARLHRVIRRSTTYGPLLPDGVMEDDGADRGIVFVCVAADLERQYEFLKTQWINQGAFFGSPDDRDPMVGPNEDPTTFTIPQRPIRRRVRGIPAFVVNRGGEYCFFPSLSALRWLSELDT